MSDNQIKSINPANFEDKENLSYVELYNNICIDDSFDNRNELITKLNEKCVQNMNVATQSSKCRE